MFQVFVAHLAAFDNVTQLNYDPATCEPESCYPMPTNCGTRTECAGCGALCFGTSSSERSAWEVNSGFTGMSTQDGSSRAYMQPYYNDIRSSNVVFKWTNLERTPDNFDLSALENIVRNADTYASQPSSGGIASISFLLWGGSMDSPDWLFQSPYNVPAFTTVCSSRAPTAGPPPPPVLKGSAGGACATKLPESYVPGECQNGFTVPDFDHPIYLERWLLIHRKLAQEITRLRELYPRVPLLYLQLCPGSTGDDAPVHFNEGGGDVTYLNYSLAEKWGCKESAAWVQYTRYFAEQLYGDVFAHLLNATDFRLMFNQQSGRSYPLEYIAQNYAGSYIKRGQEAHQFQSGDERTRAADVAHWIHSVQNGGAVRSRGEMSSETCWSGDPPGSNWFGAGVTVSPNCQMAKKEYYSMAKFVMTVKLDFWNVQPDAGGRALADPTSNFGGVWRQLNRYGGMRWGWQARGAFIGFRDGLDFMDVSRFSEAEFGVSGGGDTRKRNRARAICATYAAQGCMLEDIEIAIATSPMTVRRGNATNDVGYNIWRSDYGLFMRQRNVSASTGWFNQGPRDQLFGRFARGFATPTDPDAVIGLELDQGLWEGLPLTSTRRLTLRVAFLDSAAGTFSIGYDSMAGARTLAVDHTGSGRWVELCWRVTDGRFGQQGADDIWLSNTDAVGELFDSVEIYETPAWDDLSLEILTGCQTYDEQGALLVFPPPPSPTPPSPPPCVDALSRCPRKIADGSWTCAQREADCAMTCGICGVPAAPLSAPPPPTPPPPAP